MKAYLVRETHEDGCCVRFADHSVVARREGANELGTDFEAVECRRAPEFDAYAPGPVPDPVLVEHGWWFECMQCSQRICNEPTDEDGAPIELSPIYLTNWIFCTPACHEAFQAERAAEKARADAAGAAALANWPGITVRFTNGHETPARVDFAFPGGLGSVTWRVGEQTVLVPQRDVDAWNKFADECRAHSQVTG
jgi:hypothetical protein